MRTDTIFYQMFQTFPSLLFELIDRPPSLANNYNFSSQEVIESVLIYKFTNLSREEIEAMFSLSDLKQTRFYQEAKAEGRQEGRQEGKLQGKLQGKLETVPLLLELGLSIEQIAERLNLDLELVRTAAGNFAGDTLSENN